MNNVNPDHTISKLQYDQGLHILPKFYEIALDRTIDLSIFEDAIPTEAYDDRMDGLLVI